MRKGAGLIPRLLLRRWLRSTSEICERHNYIATANLIENWFGETGASPGAPPNLFWVGWDKGPGDPRPALSVSKEPALSLSKGSHPFFGC